MEIQEHLERQRRTGNILLMVPLRSEKKKKEEETATKEDNWDAVSHLQRHTATNKMGISNCAGRSRRTNISTVNYCPAKRESSGTC